MKSLITAICVFLSITGFVIFSSLYISNICKELSELANALPCSVESMSDEDFDSFNDIFSTLIGKWESHKVYIRCTIGHSESEEIDDTLDELSAGYSTGDIHGYISARKKLLSLIDELRLAELPTLYALG